MTALEVFRILPDSDKKDISSAIEALKKRFKPTDIEELRGLEFHHISQGDSSIEQLGIHIQQLGRKAFPSITDLVARARIIEEYEKQYDASAAVQGVTGRMNVKVIRRGFPGSQQPKSDLPRPKGKTDKPNGKAEPPTKDKPQCYNCKEVGHKRHDCPQRPEAPGCGVSSNTGMVGADIRLVSKPSIDPSTFTEEQLEYLLAQKRHKQEEEQLASSIGNVIAVPEETARVVGPVLTMDVGIEGVTVTAMVDTGAQSTIISWGTLHAVAKHM